MAHTPQKGHNRWQSWVMDLWSRSICREARWTFKNRKVSSVIVTTSVMSNSYSNILVCKIGCCNRNINLGLQGESCGGDVKDLLVLIVLLQGKIQLWNVCCCHSNKLSNSKHCTYFKELHTERADECAIVVCNGKTHTWPVLRKRDWSDAIQTYLFMHCVGVIPCVVWHTHTAISVLLRRYCIG